MRAATLILIVCFAHFATARPSINAHVSKRDLAEISAVIRAATTEPILSIDPVYQSEQVPNSVPYNTIEIQIEHGMAINRPIVIYERTDRASVRTGSHRHLSGGAYEVQRSGKA
jgi:hypothetical protein